MYNLNERSGEILARSTITTTGGYFHRERAKLHLHKAAFPNLPEGAWRRKLRLHMLVAVLSPLCPFPPPPLLEGCIDSYSNLERLRK